MLNFADVLQDRAGEERRIGNGRRLLPPLRGLLAAPLQQHFRSQARELLAHHSFVVRINGPCPRQPCWFEPQIARCVSATFPARAYFAQALRARLLHDSSTTILLMGLRPSLGACLLIVAATKVSERCA